jgi:hypothetical protein
MSSAVQYEEAVRVFKVHGLVQKLKARAGLHYCEYAYLTRFMACYSAYAKKSGKLHTESPLVRQKAGNYQMFYLLLACMMSETAWTTTDIEALTALLD